MFVAKQLQFLHYYTINWGIMYSNRNRSNNDICFPMLAGKKTLVMRKNIPLSRKVIEQNDKFLNVVS